MIYFMTGKRDSDRGQWTRCKAKTLLGAKRECTRDYGAGYHDATLCVGAKDHPAGDIQTVSERSNWNYNTVWIDVN